MGTPLFSSAGRADRNRVWLGVGVRMWDTGRRWWRANFGLVGRWVGRAWRGGGGARGVWGGGGGGGGSAMGRSGGGPAAAFRPRLPTSPKFAGAAANARPKLRTRGTRARAR